MAKEIQVQWNKCKKNEESVWCNLFTFDVGGIHSTLSGNYIIWRSGENDVNPVIDTGSGKIVQRILAHRNQDWLKKIKQSHRVYVTWTEVNKQLQLGVESYLADHYGLKGAPNRQYPDDPHVIVNIP